MSATLTPEQIQLIREPRLAQFVTLMPDGSPYIAPVWIDTDGEHVLVNTGEGRVKVRNLEQDPRVAVGTYDAANPFTRVLNIRGRVIEVSKKGAAAHIDDLSEKYTGHRPYPNHNPDLARLIVKILPEQTF